MSVQTDVKAGSLAASGTVFAGRTRVRGLIIEPGASAGSVVLKDGGAGGTTIPVSYTHLTLPTILRV